MIVLTDAVPLLIGLAIFPVSRMLWSRRVWRARRERFLEGRDPLTDAAFLAMVGVLGPETALLPAIRRSVAEMCEVPPEAIHPDDDMDQLEALMCSGDGWDAAGFARSLDEQIDRPLTTSDGSLPLSSFVLDRATSRGATGSQDFREWATGIASLLHEAGIRVEKPAGPKESGTFDRWLDVV